MSLRSNQSSWPELKLKQQAGEESLSSEDQQNHSKKTFHGRHPGFIFHPFFYIKKIFSFANQADCLKKSLNSKEQTFLQKTTSI
jgi:hypothetical protein